MIMYEASVMYNTYYFYAFEFHLINALKKNFTHISAEQTMHCFCAYFTFFLRAATGPYLTEFPTRSRKNIQICLLSFPFSPCHFPSSMGSVKVMFTESFHKPARMDCDVESEQDSREDEISINK